MNAIETVVDLSPAEAEEEIRESLAEQGFGVLTEIDVAATLKAKLGVERRPLKILGACNPAFAHQALELDPSVSVLLPCNVVVEKVDNGTKVAAVDPLELIPDPVFGELAAEVGKRLRAAVDRVGRGRPAGD